MKYNDLPVHTQYAFRTDAPKLHRENKDTYDKLREICTRGEYPCGGKTVVKRLGATVDKDRYKVVCNPLGLDMDHIALFCDRGHLNHGYNVAAGGIIEIYANQP